MANKEVVPVAKSLLTWLCKLSDAFLIAVQFFVVSAIFALPEVEVLLVEVFDEAVPEVPLL